MPSRIIYLAAIGMIFIGCDPNSTGSKDTEQLNNDNDPTNIEAPIIQDNRQQDHSSHMDNDDGEFVVIQDFNDQDWGKFSESRSLESITNSSLNINTQNSGAEPWKSWEGHQYRIVYFSEDGSLKARALVKTRDNEEFEVSNKTLDSLNIQELRTEIQRTLAEISADHDRLN